MQPHKSSVSKYLILLAVLVCTFILMAGFKNPDRLLDSNSNATTHTVTIFRMKYHPAQLNVRKGDTVVWINKDFVPHDVTEATNKKWTSKPLKQGEKWYRVITEDINYYCDLHKVMKGVITIIK
ncbi:plastocyanin/azurin family copper-binding protein [Oceanihabitans sediminis]|uniref:plastocyanin/azurin family copper-binding protein n=1 Tax=Oceanihabitans sediminis TaxID=1812012 RepID=UPI00299D9955|nr:plastocyanin/azurin family copper-binding protein [Oceanihabitans sediminis]MDX1279433.1 plastocyanin/azurin family copper-binding protein [Oceanihabitans sediminis]